MALPLLSRFAGTRCLVTGGLGFIGSNVALALAEAGAAVTVIDSLVPRHGGNRHNLGDAPIEVVVADIADGTAVARPASTAQYVFNLAGQVSHLDSMEDPLGDLDINTRSQLGFLELLRRVNPDAVVVFASTRQIYGRPLYLPVDEDHPIRPVDVNGISKYAAEQLHILYASVHGMAASAMRLTNVYGPRQRLLGDRQGFLPIFIRRALEDQPLTVYGDGTQERDCIHVDDVVSALAEAALSPEPRGQVFNLGHESLTLLQIAEHIVEVAGSGSVELIPWPPERQSIDIGSYRGDYSKAKMCLGWEPTIGFEQGIVATIDWYRPRLSHYL
jgi:nucleoside-diphosphate-sugar epimerase